MEMKNGKEKLGLCVTCSGARCEGVCGRSLPAGATSLPRSVSDVLLNTCTQLHFSIVLCNKMIMRKLMQYVQGYTWDFLPSELVLSL